MKISFTFIGLFLTLVSSAQVSIKLNEHVKFQMPLGTVKFYDEETVQQMLKITSLKQKMIESIMGETYIIDDIKFSFHVPKYQPKKSIEAMESSSKNIFSPKKGEKNNFFTSEKRIINDNIFLINEFQVDKNWVFNFFCKNPKSNVSLRGKCRCDLSDKEKAKKILESFYKSVVIE